VVLFFCGQAALTAVLAAMETIKTQTMATNGMALRLQAKVRERELGLLQYIVIRCYLLIYRTNILWAHIRRKEN